MGEQDEEEPRPEPVYGAVGNYAWGTTVSSGDLEASYPEAADQDPGLIGITGSDPDDDSKENSKDDA